MLRVRLRSSVAQDSLPQLALHENSDTGSSSTDNLTSDMAPTIVITPPVGTPDHTDFELQFSSSSNFDDADSSQNAGSVSGSTFNVAPDAQQSEGVKYLRVKALPDGAWSNTLQITLDPSIPEFEWVTPSVTDPPRFNAVLYQLQEGNVIQVQVDSAGNNFASPTTYSHTVNGYDIVLETIKFDGGDNYDPFGAGDVDGRIRASYDGGSSWTDWSDYDTVTVA